MSVVFSNDGTAGDDHPINVLYRLIEGPFTNIYGWNLGFPKQIAETLHQVGFINVQERHNHFPLGRWHPEADMRVLGLFNQSIVWEWAVAMLSNNEALELDEEQAETLERDIYEALNNSRIHAQLAWVDCWAQKPQSHCHRGDIS